MGAYSSALTKNESLIQNLAFRLKKFLKWLWEAFVVSTRSVEVALRFAPLSVLTPLAVVSERYMGNSYFCDVAWWYTLKTLQFLGPAWQKLGQWAATRRDIFPVHVCDRLSKLHDRGFPHSWEYTQSILEESFGRDYESKGLKIDKNNKMDDALIGCGSGTSLSRVIKRL